MELEKAKQIQEEKFRQYNILDWRFKFSHSKRSFGACNYKKKINISKQLTELNDEKHFINTLLHEIAHALVGVNNNHNHVWKRKAIEIGCNGNRCYDPEVIRPPKKIIMICPNCSKEYHRHKITKKGACSDCCIRYNNGKYDSRFILKIRQK